MVGHQSINRSGVSFHSSILCSSFPAGSAPSNVCSAVGVSNSSADSVQWLTRTLSPRSSWGSFRPMVARRMRESDRKEMRAWLS